MSKSFARVSINRIRWTLLPCLGMVMLSSISNGRSAKIDPSLDFYLHLRRENKIRYGASEVALETTLGTRVLEVKAFVKGVIQQDQNNEILVESSTGTSLFIKADSVPDWLASGNTEARLIVRVFRETATSELKLRMLAAAPEADIADVEEQEREKDARKPISIKPPSGAVPSRNWTASRTDEKAPIKQWYIPTNRVAPYYAEFIHHENPRVSYQAGLKISNTILAFALEYGVDPRLIMAIVMTESDFNVSETSHSGAMGLGQLMPSNVQDLGISNPYDTQQNLFGTVKLIRDSLLMYKKKTGKEFESLVLTLAGYNAGDGAVRRFHGIPPYKETQDYVRKVIRRYYGFCGYRLH